MHALECVGVDDFVGGVNSFLSYSILTLNGVEATKII